MERFSHRDRVFVVSEEAAVLASVVSCLPHDGNGCSGQPLRSQCSCD